MVIEKNGTKTWKNKREKKKTGAGHERKKEDRLGHREERNESMKSNQNRKITHSTVYGMVIEKNGTNPWKNMWENTHINVTKKSNFFTCPIMLTRLCRLPAFCDVTASNGLVSVKTGSKFRRGEKCTQMSAPLWLPEMELLNVIFGRCLWLFFVFIL